MLIILKSTERVQSKIKFPPSRPLPRPISIPRMGHRSGSSHLLSDRGSGAAFGFTVWSHPPGTCSGASLHPPRCNRKHLAVPRASSLNGKLTDSILDDAADGSHSSSGYVRGRGSAIPRRHNDSHSGNFKFPSRPLEQSKKKQVKLILSTWENVSVLVHTAAPYRPHFRGLPVGVYESHVG